MFETTHLASLMRVCGWPHELFPVPVDAVIDPELSTMIMNWGLTVVCAAAGDADQATSKAVAAAQRTKCMSDGTTPFAPCVARCVDPRAYRVLAWRPNEHVVSARRDASPFLGRHERGTQAGAQRGLAPPPGG